MSDFGISEKNDATPMVMEALKKANNENVVLVFPKGKYNFYPDRAFGKYQQITNHDNSYKYFAFPLINCKNIEIDGQGSEFIFHGMITPFVIEHSDSIALRNFSIDWEEPFYLQAKVLERNPKEMSMDVEVNPMTPHAIEGNRLCFTTNGFYMPFLGEMMVFDPKTKAVAYNSQNYLINGVSSCSDIDQYLGGQKYRIKAKFSNEPAPKGLIYVFKGMNSLNRLVPAIELKSAKNVLLENINIYHAGGMGVIAEKTENIHLNSVNVKLREGSERMVSTTADATHFCNCKGNLLVENCLFENMLDDAINVHGTYLTVDKIIDNNTVIARKNHFQQFGDNFTEKGDSMDFIKHENLSTIGSAIVKKVSTINDHLAEITFKNPIPNSLKEGDALDNVTWYPQFTFRNNIVRNNRARSVLVSTRNKTIIENNSFSSSMTSILFEGDLNHWFESGSVDDVTIRNNVFNDNVYGGGKGSVIWINPRVEVIDKDNPFENKITIENNTFRTFDNSILSAKSVKNLIFKNNTVVETYTYPKLNSQLPALDIQDCLNTTIQGNTYQGKEKAKIKVDDNSKRNLDVDRVQKGFLLE